MIKILHVVSSLSTGSGVMSVIMNYYQNINKERIQFDFLFFKELDNTYKNEIENLGGNVHLISKPSLSPMYRNELKLFFEQHEGEYTALHIHEVYLTFLLAPLAKKYGIKNIITHSHTTMYSDKKLNAFRNKLLCSRLKVHANHFFACSKDAGIFLYGKSNIDKLIIINNAVNFGKFRYKSEIRGELRKELGLESNFVIGHIGRFNEQKNHMFLIDVFYEIQKLRKHAKLLLVGEGPLLEKVKEKVKNLKLTDDVLFLGKRDDVPNLLQASDIFLLPSLFEGLPVVGVEAQVSGLPIVMSENITREIGILNSHYINLNETASHWANYILNIEENPAREEAVVKLRNGGFDISIEARKLEKKYINMESKV